MTSPYVKQTSYYFVVDGVGFNITNIHKDWLEIEEDAKNGQEDTHFMGTMELREGRWVVNECRDNLFYIGISPETLEYFINTHGVPSD